MSRLITPAPAPPTVDGAPAAAPPCQLAFQRPPRKVFWVESGHTAAIHWDPRHDLLTTVHYGPVGMLQFGTAAAGPYSIEVDIQQPRWVGDVGLFFGYQEWWTESGRAYQYQCIVLEPDTADPEPIHAFRVARYLVRSSGGG